MLALVFGAVRTRAAQMLTILVLTMLAAAVAAAGPWYGFAAVGDAAGAYLTTAPAAQRTVTVANRVDVRDDPRARLDRFVQESRAGLPAGLADGVGGMLWPVSTRSGAAAVSMPVAYRDGFCDHVRIEGACPSADREVAITRETAQRLGIGVGDVLPTQTTSADGPLGLRVVGLYAITDPAGTYWNNSMFRGGGVLDPGFTTPAVFAHNDLRTPNMAYDAVVPDAMLRGDGGLDLAAEISAADRRLGSSQLRLTTRAGPLAEAIARDRFTILNGVLTTGVQLLILTWFAVGLAGWYTSRDRRADAALLKLRGVGRFGRLRLAWGQHLVPLTGGVLLGAPAGYLLARLLAGPVPVSADRDLAVLASAAAVAAVLIGGLIVLAAVETVVLGRPVAVLLRPAGTERGAWRPAVADLLLLVVAAAAIYQARSDGPDDGLGPAAPALVALAVGLILARLLGRAADRGGGAALRAGRLRTGLTALRFSRAPGTDRVLTLLVVAVALFLTAAGGWGAEAEARRERSGTELGASRVLTVEAANRTALLHAVRGADPGGREAMAAVHNRDDDIEILEVDTARLAAVTGWRPEYGPAGALPSAVAADGRPTAPPVTGDRLTLTARRDGPAELALVLRLQHEATGLPVTVPFGTLRAGAQTVSAPVTGCAAAPGCRIVRWELTTPPGPEGRVGAPPAGTTVSVLGLRLGDTGPAVLDGAALGDIARWRAGTGGAALDVTAGDGALRMAADSTSAGQDQVGVEAWAADTPLPLPALLAGAPPADWQEGEALLTAYGEPAPVQVSAVVAALPRLGRAGLIIDLDAARRIAAETDPGGAYQVWLAAGARPGIVADLTAAGLTVTADDTVTAHTARLGAQAPAVAVRFGLIAGTAALLLAAATVAVGATVDRRSLAEQFAALRDQGLSRRVAVTTGWAGAAALILAGLLGGLLAALLAVHVTGRTVPRFADGWAVLDPPDPLNPVTTVLALVAALAVLGLTAWAALSPLLRALRAGEGRR
ncbi:FtsX-like permease family protein [Actinoplanes sp. G11-F43]|uniref:FtsX-like permease family protein n=1 Tax=Actinoplanes sp. G11-F43 TaxID=3424130 RepID=UPI003D3418CA